MRLPTLPPPFVPLPVFVPLAVSVSALVVQNADLLTEKLVLRHFKVPISLRGLLINPLCRTVTISKVHVFDPLDNKLLLAIDKTTANFTFSNNGKLFPKAPVHLDVDVDVMKITTTLYFQDKAHRQVSSNWTKLTQFYNDLAPATSSPPSSASFPCSFAVQVHHPKLFIQTSSNQAITPLITIPRLHVTSDQLTSLSNATQLVDSLTTRVLDKFKPRTFRNDVRGLVRLWLRRRSSTTDIVDEAIEWSKFNVSSLRSRLRRFQSIADDLPGLEQVQAWTSQLDQYLQGAERILKLTEPDESPSLDANGDSNGNDPHPEPPVPERAAPRGNDSRDGGTESTPRNSGGSSLESTIMEEFRELDEDIP